MGDGLRKNIEVCKEQITDWAGRMKSLLIRLMDFRSWFDPKSKNNLLHVLVGFIEETFDAMPRVLTYLFIVYWAGHLIGYTSVLWGY